MAFEISLANKCQLLFGAAIVLIITAALFLPWLLLGSILNRSEWEAARQVALLWPQVEAVEIDSRGLLPTGPPEGSGAGQTWMRIFEAPAERFEEVEAGGGFAAAALRRFREHEHTEFHEEAVRIEGERAHRLARAVRDDGGALTDMVIVERSSPRAAARLFTNRLYLLSAAFFAGGLAVLVFYLITTRLILSPVRQLRATAERVRAGNLGARADIQTGDEFEDLAEAFNGMLANLETGQEQLRIVNNSLDLKVAELEQSNMALSESARMKNEFLASVSHELRTPLNSIIGFAELLENIAEAEKPIAGAQVDAAQYTKRRRYLQNIVGAGRSLLEMINELLDMAKIEAGKVDLRVEAVSVADVCEGLAALIRPQSERKNLSLSVEAPKADDGDGALVAETDQRKLQQIIFNLLSNAVKFTPEGGSVTVRAERIFGRDGEPRVKVSVLDTGPGIGAEDHERIFEKFVQLEAGHTRQHTGTGLGLAIARDLATMIQGEIQLVSEVGRGSMFSLVIPQKMDPGVAAQMTLRLAGRGPSPFPASPQEAAAGG